MLAMTEIRIPTKRVQSLVWDGDSLVDWVDGGQRYLLDGNTISRQVRYGFPFDSAVSLVGSRFSVIYTRCGTKALVLDEGRVFREINRSYYHADAYEYPIAVFRLPTGREVLAHCPDDYCRLEIEDLATGEVLTKSMVRKPTDVFHSRLAASPDGRYLLSAGWVWHPLDCISVYDINAALEDPTHLDGKGVGIDAWAEESSASFLPDGRLAVALKGDIDSEDSPTARGELMTYDLRRPNEPAVVAPVGRLGTIMAMGGDHILALYDHPRLIDVRTGVELQSWPQMRSGTQVSSIVGADPQVPVVAVDPVGRRFALGDADGITVVQAEALSED
ncbi:hypothetical protein OOT46_24465 [Aquabacterium sp. A7-Y]|uniref:hypothetical protein n=1 Tax=Aquabacterium sp. A7-Y TaxID=1349605 RepID=UPI00223C8F74|nr:hypothetical protein [Aquabacterium sp. A7-Y]MCW7540980.1 hypothetical protein [Aquabacterium sp. A7-Y]